MAISKGLHLLAPNEHCAKVACIMHEEDTAGSERIYYCNRDYVFILHVTTACNPL